MSHLSKLEGLNHVDMNLAVFSKSPVLSLGFYLFVLNDTAQVCFVICTKVY